MSMITPEEFLAIVKAEAATSEHAIGTIPSNYAAGNPTVIIDGETAATTKSFRCLKGYLPAANDRVLLLTTATSAIVLGKISATPESTGTATIQSHPDVYHTSFNAVDVASQNVDKNKHVSNVLAKGWEDHKDAMAPHPGHLVISDADMAIFNAAMLQGADIELPTASDNLKFLRYDHVNGTIIFSNAGETGGIQSTSISFSKAGILTVTLLPFEWYPPEDIVILTLSANVSIAPEGCDLIVEFRKNGVASGTVTIPEGSKRAVNNTITPVAFTTADALQIAITQVGSTIAGSYLIAQAYYTT